jgi:hypothetical protein
MKRETSHADRAPVRLRGHHFICLQFFEGQGYSASFVDNLKSVVERVRTHPAETVAGADSVCAACPGLAADGTCLDPLAGETEVRRIDRLAWQLLGAGPAQRLSLAEAREALSADRDAAMRWRESACRSCTWEELCRPRFDELVGSAQER